MNYPTDEDFREAHGWNVSTAAIRATRALDGRRKRAKKGASAKQEKGPLICSGHPVPPSEDAIGGTA